MKSNRRNMLIRYKKITEAFNDMYHNKGMRLECIYEEINRTMGYAESTVRRALKYDLSELDDGK